MRFLSVCSGMEAASVAWEPLGWKAVGFSEIEPFPCAILKHRFPNTSNYGSLTEYQSWPLGPDSIDLLVGGTPCQSFSVAGLRKGLADPRGNLALVFLGLADKLRPRWIVWENVPGVLSSDGGRDFGSFLGALELLGYGWAYRVLDAQHFGVPQRRRRVFVVASLGGRDVAASVLLEPESVCWNPTSRRKKGQATAPDAGSGVEAGGRKWPADTACTLNASFGDKQGLEDQHALNATHETQTIVTPIVSELQPFSVAFGAAKLENTAPTIMANGGPNRHGEGSWSATQFTGVIQPIPFRKSKRACSTTDNETWVEAEASNTLNNFDLGDTRTTHAVVEPICFEPRSQDGHARISGDVSPTLNTAQGGQRQPCVAITFQPGNLRREAGADPSTTTTTTTTLKASAGDQMPHVAYCAETAGTLTVGHHSCAGHQHRMGDNSFLIAPVVPLDGMNLLSRLGPCGETHSIQNFTPGDPSFTLKKGGNQHGVLTPMAVRRLTPTECERLQGFPDNWSRISWKGKPEDQCPDGPRYKACGNSMAVPVMRWIGEQIARVELSHNQPTNTNA